MSAGIFSGAAAAAAGDIKVSLSDQAQVGSTGGAGSCSAGVKLLRNGQYHAGSNNSSTTPSYFDVGGAEWADRESAAIGDIFEARMVTTTGSLTVGTADTWQAISTDREYKVSVSGIGAAFFTGTLEIRRGSTTLASAAIALTAVAV